MRSNFLPNRVPRGVPTGGQFAPTNHHEPTGVELTDDASAREDDFEAFLADRRERIRAGGYVAPAAMPRSAVDPRSSAYVREWWEAVHATAEYGHEAGAYPQMPDDYTPSRKGGQSLTGHRRTHRVAYRGAGVVMRMPSATAIRRYAGELMKTDAFDQDAGTVTFDVPVTATSPGGEATGWVRVTHSLDGTWATRALSFPPEAQGYIAEASQCVLQARRPTRALSETGDLLERRRMRAAEIGTKLDSVRSAWIRAAGYEPASGTMVVTTATHEYGYKVPAAVFSRVRTSKQPGGVFNQLVRGRAQRVEVRQCEKCGRFTAADIVTHRCPPKEAHRLATTPVQNELSRLRFMGGSK